MVPLAVIGGMSALAGTGAIHPAALARTYDARSYADTWDAVRDYHAVLDYHARHPDRGSTAVASALDLPRGRVRSWLEGSVPDPVRGIQRASEHGWIDPDLDSGTFRGLNALVAWVFSGGSIDSQWYVPRFSVDREANRELIDRAFETLGVEYDFIRSTSAHRATEYRPVEDAAVLGRVLTVLGAPTGTKNDRSSIELPAYLEGATDLVRREFIQVYLLNRGQRPAGKGTVTFREDRPPVYLASLAELIGATTGERTTVSEKNVIVSTAGAEVIDHWPPVLTLAD